MRIKRVLQGTALTALAAAAWMGAGSDASAAVSNTGIAPDINGNYVLNVTGTGHEIMVGVAKVNKNTGKATVTSWDVYDGTSAAVDLSKLNVSNDNYIAIKDNDEQVTFIGIPAASKKNTISFNAATGRITEVKTKVVSTDGTAPNIEYRTVNSNWSKKTPTGNIDLAKYQYQSATLYVRIPAGDMTKSSTFKDSVKYNDKDYSVTNVGSLPSKETKLNIKKQANGPAVTLDYTKGTAKVKKGTEYRIVGTNVVSGEAVGANGSTLNVTELVAANDTEAVLEVRTKAKTDGSTVKQNKVASKWTRVSIQKLKAFVGGDNAFKDSAEYAKVTSSGSVEIATVSGGVIKVGFTTSGRNANKKINGISIENTSDNIYEVAVATTGSSIKKLNGKKTLKLTAEAGNNVYIRVAGNKSKKVWVGDWACLGKVDKLEDNGFAKVD